MLLWLPLQATSIGCTASFGVVLLRNQAKACYPSTLHQSVIKGTLAAWVALVLSLASLPTGRQWWVHALIWSLLRSLEVRWSPLCRLPFFAFCCRLLTLFLPMFLLCRLGLCLPWSSSARQWHLCPSSWPQTWSTRSSSSRGGSGALCKSQVTKFCKNVVAPTPETDKIRRWWDEKVSWPRFHNRPKLPASDVTLDEDDAMISVQRSETLRWLVILSTIKIGFGLACCLLRRIFFQLTTMDKACCRFYRFVSLVASHSQPTSSRTCRERKPKWGNHTRMCLYSKCLVCGLCWWFWWCGSDRSEPSLERSGWCGSRQKLYKYLWWIQDRRNNGSLTTVFVINFPFW